MKLKTSRIQVLDDFENLVELYYWSEEISLTLDKIEEKGLQYELMILLDDKAFEICDDDYGETTDELYDYLMYDLENEDGFKWLQERNK